MKEDHIRERVNLSIINLSADESAIVHVRFSFIARSLNINYGVIISTNQSFKTYICNVFPGRKLEGCNHLHNLVTMVSIHMLDSNT